MNTVAPTTVLIIGSVDDSHVLEVARQVRELGGNPFVFDMYNENHRIDLRIAKSGCACRFVANEEELLDTRVLSVWWRLKPKLPAEYRGAHSNETEAFRLREWRSTLRSLPPLLANVPWVNQPEAQEQMSHKLRQLRLASQLGFRLPETVVTNSHSAAASIFAGHPRAIYKVVSWYFHVPDVLSDTSLCQTVYTTEVARDQLLSASQSIALAPGQFQELVHKAYELRVNVVGESVFVARINSQRTAETEIDWRRNQPADMYEHADLTDSTRERLLEFHKAAGLKIGAYDFIVTPHGDEIFLECNPAGQWLWIEQRLGSEISRTLGKLLVEPRSRAAN